MPQSLEERVAYLEGKVEEHSRGFGDLAIRIGAFSGRFDALDQKVDRCRLELSGRIDALATRIDGSDQKVDRFRLELSGRIDALATRIDALDQKVSMQFVWLVGIQVAVLLAVISAVIAALLR